MTSGSDAPQPISIERRFLKAFAALIPGALISAGLWATNHEMVCFVFTFVTAWVSWKLYMETGAQTPQPLSSTEQQEQDGRNGIRAFIFLILWAPTAIHFGLYFGGSDLAKLAGAILGAGAGGLGVGVYNHSLKHQSLMDYVRRLVTGTAKLVGVLILIAIAVVITVASCSGLTATLSSAPGWAIIIIILLVAILLK